MFLTWDVGQHDDDEAVVVVEGHVVLVGKPHAVHSRSAYVWQSGVDAQQLSDDPDRVQDDEEVVSGTEKRSFLNVSVTSHTFIVTCLQTHSPAVS